jgi:hypothetical protein
MTRAALVIIAGLAPLILTRPLLAHVPTVPEHILTVGPTLAYAHAPRLESALVYGVDVAYTYTLFWGGAGARVFETFEADERKVLPYVEVGVFLLLNVGGGYTLDTAPRSESLSGPHLFIGLPVPFSKLQRGAKSSFFYAEPYYRATYAEVGTLHEGGALVKWTGFM